MPIFEYLCPACNRIFSFLSLSPRPATQPVCPRCGATDLRRVPSAFAVARASGSVARSSGSPADHASDDAPSAALESEMMKLAGGLSESDAEDPRTMARVMRRMAEMSGEPITPTMHEMFRRMESGEDPELLESELGPQLEAEMGETDAAAGGPGTPTRDDGLYNL